MSSAADWRPKAPLHVLKARGELLSGVRAFFARHNVLEVETPVLAQSGVMDPSLSSFSVTYTGPGIPGGRRLFLQTSPEFAMKRLLAAGSGDIYQIARVFRDGEAGRSHNPEFTLLEWYRVGYDHWRLMDEIEALVRHVYPSCPPFSRVAYGDLFQYHLGIDPLVADEHEALEAARSRDLEAVGNLDRDGWLDLLFTHVVEPELAVNGAVFVHGFPASQAALARLSPEDERVSERFELYINGIELANGFHELSDSVEQRRRFEKDGRRRLAIGLPPMELDERLLAAMSHGLPDCSGVALGLDRLLMLMTGADRLSEVLVFPVDIA